MPISSAWAVISACLALICASCAPDKGILGADKTPRTAPQRIISLDYCADQFVLKLADRDQILALSPEAEREFSYMRAAAKGVRKTRASAESVLALQPDLVVRAYGGGVKIGDFLSRTGIEAAQLGFAEDFDGVRANIRAMAQAMGQVERGETLIADMDRKLAAVGRTNGAPRKLLYLTPAGVTSGEGTLVHELILAAGLDNFEREAGWRPIPLERLAREQPDRIGAASFGAKADNTDAWSSARHPIAQKQLRDLPVVALEGAWTSCGGWFLVEAVEAMAAAR